MVAKTVDIKPGELVRRDVEALRIAVLAPPAFEPLKTHRLCVDQDNLVLEF